MLNEIDFSQKSKKFNPVPLRPIHHNSHRPSHEVSHLFHGLFASSAVSMEIRAMTKPPRIARGTPTDTPSVAQCVRGEESIPIGVDTCVDEAPCQWVGEESYAYFGYSLMPVMM